MSTFAEQYAENVTTPEFLDYAGFAASGAEYYKIIAELQKSALELEGSASFNFCEFGIEFVCPST